LERTDMNEKMPLETLTISVRPSPETNDHEVLLQSEEGDLIERFGDRMIGLDPDDILVEPCALLPGSEPRTALIGRCDCGIIGCGSVEVTISTDGQVVSWTTDERTVGVQFDAAQYAAEVRRALGDFSWETADRTAARLIANSVDRDRLAGNGMRLVWASGRIAQNAMTIALEYDDGRYQVLVQVPWQDEAPEAIADACSRLLRTEPRSWGDVRWFPQAPGLGAPRIAGPGWRPGTN
jgi:hypothetical protein